MAFPSMTLEGKTALITGAGSGIGKAIALAAAESGADCAVCELPDRMHLLDSVCEEIERQGRRSGRLSGCRIFRASTLQCQVLWKPSAASMCWSTTPVSIFR